MSTAPTVRGFVFAAATLVAFSFTTHNAYAAVLQSLFDGGELTIGDKRFFDWTLEADDSIDGFTAAPEPRDFTKIDVTAISNGPLELGVKYTDLGSEMSSAGGTFDLVSFTWTYRVATISLDPLIIGSELDMTGTFDVGSSGDFAFVDINEDVFKADAATQIADMEVLAFGDDLGSAITFDSAAFPGESGVFVRSKVELSSGLTDPGSLSEFVQTFLQQEPPPGVIPEPSTFVVFAVGIAILLPISWRRRRKLAA